MKKIYVSPAMLCVTLKAEKMMATSGVSESGDSVGFSNESGDVGGAAVKEDRGWDIWDE